MRPESTNKPVFPKRLNWRDILLYLTFANFVTAAGTALLSDLTDNQELHYVFAAFAMTIVLLPVALRAHRLSRRINKLLDERDIYERDALNLRRAIDQHSIFTITDAAGVITFVNDLYCTTHGYQREELQGKTHEVVNRRFVSPEFQSEFQTKILDGKAWHGELCNRRKDGSYVWLQSTISPVLDDHGKIQQIIAIKTDITEQKKAQERLFQQQSLLSQILEVMPGAVFWKDRNCVYGGCNGVFAKLAGLRSSSDIVGKDDFQMPWKPSEAIAYRADDQEVMGNDKAKLNIEESQLNAAGEMTHVLTSKVPLHGSDGNVIGVLGCYIDITAMRRAQNELRAAKELADAANRAKSDFLANMSHEIRTPMTAILGFAELLAEHPTAREQREFVSNIQRNGEHLLTVINDILDLSKIEAGKLEVEGVPTNPVQVLKEVATGLRTRAVQKHLDLQLQIADDLPVAFRSDPTRLRQILINLIGNAIKFTERGSVSLKLCAKDDTLRYEVSDTGPGMSEAMLGRLFQPFTQADNSTTRRYGGTGLGLIISQRLASLLRGRIEVQSAVGKGSTFTLILPAEPMEAIAPQDAPPAVAVDSIAPLQGKRIVVAEDGLDNQRLIKLLLTRAGATIELVENGKEAVARLMDASSPIPDLLLLDMQMPEMDGYTAARTLRSAGFTQPIIALTANAMADDRRKCVDAGCDDYVSKPINRNALVEVISRFCNPREESRPAA